MRENYDENTLYEMTSIFNRRKIIKGDMEGFKGRKGEKRREKVVIIIQ